MITVQGLTKRFGPFTAIRDISFHLDRGEVVGFLGPNGAGKTTTMRILSGYMPATEGSVEIAGLDVLRQSLAARRKIGYLPESVPLYPEHRVTEMLGFQARLHGMPRAEARRRIPEVLERVGIDHRSRSLIGTLSRGQRQRVGLAVALLPAPEVLILDEPTSGLDPLQRIEVRGLLKELADQHTVLISSHILPEIDAVCPRVIIINEGVIAADGRPDELVRALGVDSHVRVEAVVGDPAEAARLLAALPGVGRVRDAGRLGIHHQFEVLSEEDLREDVGALAAQKGWALRELSFRRGSLEELFAGIALGLRDGAARPDEAGSATAAATPAPDTSAPVASGGLMGIGGLAVMQPSESPAPTPPPPDGGSAELGQPSNRVGQQVYNLNPFDQGASRDLGTPKRIEEPPRPADEQRRSEHADDEGGGASTS